MMPIILYFWPLHFTTISTSVQMIHLYFVAPEATSAIRQGQHLLPHIIIAGGQEGSADGSRLPVSLSAVGG